MARWKLVLIVVLVGLTLFVFLNFDIRYKYKQNLPIETKISETKKSDDKTYTEKEVKQSLAIKCIIMIDERLGFVVEDDNILRTIDGGKTWSEAIVSNFSIGNLPDGIVYDFINCNMGWVVIGSTDESNAMILKTIDGGQTWNVKELSGIRNVAALDFIDQDNGWLMANTDGALGSQVVEIFHTKDGGENWIKIMTNEPDKETHGALPFAGHKYGISFRDIQTGWTVVDCGGLDEKMFYVTRDGGYTWHAEKLLIPKGIELLNVGLHISLPKFFSNREGMFWGVSLEDTKGKSKIVFFQTEDGGISWKPSMPITISGKFAIDFVNLKEGWIISDGYIYKTKDGAQHWEQISTDINLNGNVKFTLVNSNDGWIIRKDISKSGTWHLYKTNDGGYTWSEIEIKK
ncbi:WD40/YVTN/BNR-like repeat-containing protein [Caloranaerobacter azorensis]|uniref:Photosynthesis system II assembly factor Ycf48/Hcf136-like domain-containing protein n=1 Tax=Caloranaerobacter azorensis TaxID=116090 RepID=A0A6P1YDJ2_9FIRM|nr:YCF48-related protein [Caloranaerobacter azorensis]QIB26813.1 hypothetical protein G3A45_05560 [Caloranaerobacter azorensis]